MEGEAVGRQATGVHGDQQQVAGVMRSIGTAPTLPVPYISAYRLHGNRIVSDLSPHQAHLSIAIVTYRYIDVTSNQNNSPLPKRAHCQFVPNNKNTWLNVNKR